jgi:hypothetical protein
VQNEYEIRQVVTAVASILKEGRMPPNVPPRYRKALQDLADAREDRTDMRRSRFASAEKELRPILGAADSSSVSMTKRALGVDAQLTRWRQLCGHGPAPLPTPLIHAKYEHVYLASGGETIESVAEKFGFEDARPLTHPSYGYAANMHLRHGDRIFVPYTQSHLTALIESSEEMIEGAEEGAKEALERQFENQEQFEDYLLKLEAVSILVNVSVAVVQGVAITAHALRSAEAAAAREGAHEMLAWLRLEGPKTSAEILGAAIEASKAPKKGLVFLLRHSPIGWLSPSYWTSLGFALAKGEWELFLYGPEGLTEKRAGELAKQTERYVELLNTRIELMRNQLASPIYQWRGGK